MNVTTMLELETSLGMEDGSGAMNDVIAPPELGPATTDGWLSGTVHTFVNFSASGLCNDTWNGTLKMGELTVGWKHSYLKCNKFLFFFNGVLILSLCLLGMLGNTVSILVLQRDRSNQVAAFLLQALAITDNSVLALSFTVLGVLWGVFPYFQKTQPLVDSAMPYVIKYIHPFAYMALTCAVWMTVLLAINRFIAICRPFDASRLCTMTKARIQVGVVYIFSILFNFPRFFQYRISGTSAVPTSIGEHTLFGTVYTNAIYTVLVLLLPLVLLVVLNTKLILELQSMGRRRSSLSSNTNRDDNISFIMVIIIIIFIVCNTPDRITAILKNNADSSHMGPCGVVFYCINISNLLIICNSSTNFLVYYFFRARFRQILVKKVCSWYGRNGYRIGSGSEAGGAQTSMRSVKRHRNGNTSFTNANGVSKCKDNRNDHQPSPVRTTVETLLSDEIS